jgi:hypothetical protein
MANSILATVTTYLLWFHNGLVTSAHGFSVPADGSQSSVDAEPSNFILSRLLRALTVKAFWEDIKFTTGTVLGLFAILLIRYARSPWRKLPPSPRGFPIIGNALQVMDTSWLISKDCKERFGKYPTILNQGIIELTHTKCRRGDVS